jgi:SAM-dependent methyltransferase
MSEHDKSLPFDWDEAWYLRRYPDIAEAVAQGRLVVPLLHYLEFGGKEGRFPSAAAEQRAQRPADEQDNAGSVRISLGTFSVPLDWPVQGEIKKTFILKLSSGFFAKYMSGPVILDIGYKGGHADAVPIFPHAIGIDLDCPGYDGGRLPFGDASADTVFASHVLERVPDASAALREWFRVIKVGGSIVCSVPHQYLYERKKDLPSRWSGEHLRFYTPASLLGELEVSLEPNSYRVKHLADNDFGYAYNLGPEHHPSGCYEIEVVLEKIKLPPWGLL